MMLCVCVKKPTNHALVLGVVLCRFALEELDAAFAQCKSDLHTFLAKDEIFWGR